VIGPYVDGKESPGKLFLSLIRSRGANGPYARDGKKALERTALSDIANLIPDFRMVIWEQELSQSTLCFLPRGDEADRLAGESKGKGVPGIGE
jgi:hypothetical protein